jgi:hypothetical protein
MAKKEEIPTDLTLDIGGDLAPDEFVTAVRNFFGYVREVAEAQEGDGAKIDWTVKVREGSSLIGLEPSANAPPSRLAMIYNKISYDVDVMTNGEVPSSGVSEKAFTHLKALSELGEKSKKPANLRVWVRREPKAIGAGIAKAIRNSREADYWDFGTIEGRLEAIKDASGSLKIGVRDFLYPKAIVCDVPESMIERVFASFRRRVELTGKIHYRRDGVPISIEASDLDVLPEDDELPSANDVRGILASA